MRTAERDTRLRRADHHGLIKHRSGLTLTIGPRPCLPCPPVPGSGRAPNNAVIDRPRTRPRMAVDPSTVNTQYRVDPPKPLNGNAIPGGQVDILVDTEEDRRPIWTPGRTVQPQSRLSVRHAAVVPAGEVRRSRPTWLAVLITAHDMKARRAQPVRIFAGDRLEIEVCAGPQLRHIYERPVKTCRFDLIGGDQPVREIDQPKAVGRCLLRSEHRRRRRK